MSAIVFLKASGQKKAGSNAFITAPGRYRKVAEKQRKHAVNFAGRNSATVNSYDQKITIERVLIQQILELERNKRMKAIWLNINLHRFVLVLKQFQF